MGLIVAICPRCRAKDMTFDILAGREAGAEYGWKKHYEFYCECRRCFQGSILILVTRNYEVKEAVDSVEKILHSQMGLNIALSVDGYISLKDHIASNPPEHLPPDVETAFKEGAACLAVGCYNASGAMFRLAIDLATKNLLPTGGGAKGGPNRQQRKQLNERLTYLFDVNILSNDLRELATCVKDDGNDGAHDGTLKQTDVEDLQDFAMELFKRMFTEPERLRLAKLRREERSR